MQPIDTTAIFCSECHRGFPRNHCPSQNGKYSCPRGCGIFAILKSRFNGPSKVYDGFVEKGAVLVDHRDRHKITHAKMLNIDGMVRVTLPDKKIGIWGDTVRIEFQDGRIFWINQKGMNLFTDPANRIGASIDHDGTVHSGKWDKNGFLGGRLDNPKKTTRRRR